MSLNSQDRLNLKNMLKNSDCVDNTSFIRELKHSKLMRADIIKLTNLNKTHSLLKTNDFNGFLEMAQSECIFLYNNYMDIFHKLVKDEIDFTIMAKLLIVLKLIEESRVDQHEGSAMVGKILKELYIDSAIKRADNLDKEHETVVVEKIQGNSISWKDYKKMFSEPL